MENKTYNLLSKKVAVRVKLHKLQKSLVQFPNKKIQKKQNKEVMVRLIKIFTSKNSHSATHSPSVRAPLVHWRSGRSN